MFDEFSYLVKEDKSVPSVFQTVVDDVLEGTEISLALLGPSISMREEGVLSYGSPLYGRRTGHCRPEPMTAEQAAGFFSGYGADKLVRIYGVVSGIPAYLAQFDTDADLLVKVERHVLSKGGVLYEELSFCFARNSVNPRHA